MPNDRKNKIRLGDSTEINENLKPVKIGGVNSPIELSKDELRVVGTINADAINVGGAAVQTGTDAGATELNELSDVTYSSGDLTITSLDKIVAGGDLTLDTGGDLIITTDDNSGTTTIDKNVTQTTSGTFKGLFVDMDQTGNCASLNLQYLHGIEIDLNTDAATHVGIVSAIGFEATVTGGTSGLQGAYGAQLTATGADFNRGLILNVQDGGDDILIYSSANTSDYFKIQVGAESATTFSTTDADTAVGHIVLQPDGDLKLAPISGNVYVYDSDNAVDYFHIDVNANGATVLATVDVDGADASLKLNPDGDLLFDSTSANAVFLNGNIKLAEKSDAVADTAGFGQLWTKTATPNILYFTNDAGNDLQISNTTRLITIPIKEFKPSVVDYYYVPTANVNFGNSVTAADFTAANIVYTLIYKPKVQCLLHNLSLVCFSHNSSEPWEIALFDVSLPAEGSSAASTIAQIGSNIDVESSGGNVTLGRIYYVDIDLAHATTQGQAICIVARYTDGSSKKSLFINGTLSVSDL